MATFVLVHGAMHGGWCWGPVAGILRSRGHAVATPTLTGQGERHHLLTRETSVQTHIEDVVNVIDYEDLDDVCLVLHSYSGGLAGPLAERLGDRLSHVVGAGAFLQHPGESNFDVEPEASREAFRALARDFGDGWCIPPRDAMLQRWGVTDPDLVALLHRKLTPFSLTFSEGFVEFDPAPLARLPRTYIEHTEPPLPALGLSLSRARDEGWTMRRIATSHDMMLTMPTQTADLCEEAALRE
ncbi:MAG: alpha/beta fold hydrolase [Candidatus Nanopelagicales bacterium]